MKRYLLLLLTIMFTLGTNAQERMLPLESEVITKHSTTINGSSLRYTAKTGTLPLWNKDGDALATLFYTYYTRDGISDRSTRPLVISFNGGPGSASVWMHVAYTGPKVLNIDEEGNPVQPYGVHENPHSILDVADIVFVNPVNTGYSRLEKIDGEYPKREMFFGINADIKYLAEWINTFVARNNRWLSPKYLIGESYGGTRVSGLAHELQNKQWMFLNGVILVSPADYKSYSADNAISSALNLPYMAATAWHHGLLPQELQSKDLLEVLPEVEEFTINDLLPGLAKGGFISEEERKAIAKKMAYYSTLEEEDILRHNLDVPTSFYWKDVMRDERGMTVGRLDSRYLGLDKMEAGNRPEYNMELKSWLHSFTPAINYYLREELNFKTDTPYAMFGDVHPWDRSENTTRDDLRQAMAENPYLNVMFQSGYYDGATTYFNAKYTMWQLDPSGKMKDRFSFKGYRSGHMMYLRKEDLETANNDLRDFIQRTSTNVGSAKY